MILLTLKEEVMNEVNDVLKRINSKIKLLDLLLYRPTFHEIPYYIEDIDLIEDCKRANVCDKLWITFQINYEDSDYEYEARFIKNNDELELKGFFIIYCRAVETEEELLKIEEKMKDTAQLVCACIILGLRAVCP